MPAFRMLTFYITMSTIIVHVDFLLIFMGFPRFCPHYLCYVDKSWTNCHLWTNLSFFLFLTIPYFIRVCEVIYHNSFCTFCHFHMFVLFQYIWYYEIYIVLYIFQGKWIWTVLVLCHTYSIYRTIQFLIFAHKLNTLLSSYHSFSKYILPLWKAQLT